MCTGSRRSTLPQNESHKTSLVSQVSGMDLSDMPSPPKTTNPPAPPDATALHDASPPTEEQLFRFVGRHLDQSVALGDAGDAVNVVRNSSDAAVEGITHELGCLSIQQNAGHCAGNEKAAISAGERTPGGDTVDVGAASNVEHDPWCSCIVENEFVDDRLTAPSPGGAARLPRFAAVARTVRDKAVTGPNAVAKLREAFGSCGLSLDTHFKMLRKHGRRPRVACVVLCEGEALGWASAARQEDAMLYACHVVWNTFEGFSKFCTVAHLIRDGPITESNMLKKLPAAFKECGLRLDHRIVRLSCNEQEPDTFLCVVSCDGECLGHGTATNADNAKRSAFRAVLDLIANGRDIPKFEAAARLIRDNVVVRHGADLATKMSYVFKTCGLELDVQLTKLPEDDERSRRDGQSFSCDVSCDGQPLGQALGASEEEAKRFAFETAWYKFAPHPTNPWANC